LVIGRLKSAEPIPRETHYISDCQQRRTRFSCHVKRHPELTPHIASPVDVTEAWQSDSSFDALAAFGPE
jgi:hypothetical protein